MIRPFLTVEAGASSRSQDFSFNAQILAAGVGHLWSTPPETYSQNQGVIHKMKKIALTCLWLVIPACQKAPPPPPPSVSAQVFVTLKNGETLKMSGVQVSVKNKPEWDAFFKTIQDEALVDLQSSIDKYKEEQKAIDGEWSVIRKIKTQAGESNSKAQTILDRKPDDGNFNSPQYLQYLDTFEDKKKALLKTTMDETDALLAEATQRIAAVERRTQALLVPQKDTILIHRLLSAKLPPNLSAQQTDADGRVIFQQPTNPCVAVVFSSRESASGLEVYFWAIPITTTNLLINNSSLLVSGIYPK